MGRLIELNTFSDERGNLTVAERSLPFEIKRIFYIYGVNDSVRGNHRHKKTIQAAICLNGSCRISVQNSTTKPVETIILDKPSKCLILLPEDFHWMDNFSKDAILLVLASELYDKDDYIYDNYQ